MLREAITSQIQQELQQINWKQLKNPQWHVDLEKLEEYERGEAERVANKYGELTEPPTDSNALWKKVMMAAGNPSSLRMISPQEISNIDNFNGDPQTIEQVIGYLESKPRDWRSILQAFQTGGSLPAPVVIVLPNGTQHLMSGNSRLMIARALKMPVKVLYVNMQ